ncbi:iron(III) transport system ATP-binding protein/sulfate transport system ATP-binding protein [Paracoccus isoporae]|uniref:Iron(III) transport system ATP-binding protein/sulfate transport system ATP-binding protein n=1 Tax=Paracoccus isoporae TaxID=591205 RepID=A0A1G6WHC2_9RHOB|nr:ABC transporter ATP-binding protein [Paracoccus isoporae]SDD64637.1 iron(III) transport system ATP-binding protein/sulfate transport system ATP-binding protein [Paracoccus isoporae]
MSFEALDIHKSFGDTPILKGVSLSVAPGEFVALLGPSGSGKTTLLNIIAGLAHADRGRLVLDGRDITRLPAGKRRFGMVFQSYALFRHMTVAQNVAFGLKVMEGARRPPRERIAARVGELLEMVELPDLADRYPAQLSGGQRQRVAMARALAIDPQLLLMDEPFSALDAQVRQSLRGEVRALQKQAGVGAIMVTHDRAEAWALADRIAVMDHGRIVQFDTPDALRDDPATESVRSLVEGVA